jgi:hypothetical protein
MGWQYVNIYFTFLLNFDCFLSLRIRAKENFDQLFHGYWRFDLQNVISKKQLNEFCKNVNNYG